MHIKNNSTEIIYEAGHSSFTATKFSAEIALNRQTGTGNYKAVTSRQGENEAVIFCLFPWTAVDLLKVI